MTRIELLAPAGTAAIGKAAIDAGADAVYIGAERFGARTAAGNSMDDIAALVKYAHGFGARVYLTMNTLLLDDELPDAQRTAWAAYEAGVDALIVQDMAFTQFDLPPIALHASTQTFNLTPQRALFLASAGFSRIVLERGASLAQIRKIRSALPDHIELEAFVHGAICVSYSGQCYLGHALCGRGGNRGACAQPCRSQYNLVNDRGETLIQNKCLLSLRDLNLSGRLEELIGAGVCSLKIEGRLKEEDYVVNNTAYYHRLLHSSGVPRLSAGKVACGFEPNPSKSFSRGFTTYYWDGKRAGVLAPEAKSLGEAIGRVLQSDGRTLVLRLMPDRVVHNGDGLCFPTGSGRLEGASVNRAEGNRLLLNKTVDVPPGTEVYRNFDRSFRPAATRSIPTTVVFTGSAVTATDETGISATVPLPEDYDPALNRELAERNIRNAFSKSGGTIFDITEVSVPEVPAGPLPFIPAAELNGLRRRLLEELLSARLAAYRRPEPYRRPDAVLSLPPGIRRDFRANVANALAEKFYRDAGFEIVERALEAQDDPDLIGREVMRTPYCIRRETGRCLKEYPECRSEKLFLENNGVRLELSFHCAECEMGIIFQGKA
ncbi:U32 family peptidase [uncultured Rikenella sp.]|uniref:peptidase U32 family protein n=1 Tax=uncultured Rikenella sp. TaxID=368003 RepID=UPI0026136A5D|nr:U32 family peptidase [uncultured Rikenella sp.]